MWTPSTSLPRCAACPTCASRRTSSALIGFDADFYTTKYRSLVQQLAWPARCTLAALNYCVSATQQATKELCVRDLTTANTALREAKALVRSGAGTIHFKAPHEDFWTLGKLHFSAVHDAAFGNEEQHASQQGYVLLVGSKDHQLQDGHAHPVEWSSTRIHRVVRSTLAAEAACVASHAHDRACHVAWWPWL